jgi:cytochrome c1
MRFCERYCNEWLPNSDFSTPGKGCDKCRARDKEYKKNYKSNLQKREAAACSPSAHKKLKSQVVNRDTGGETDLHDEQSDTQMMDVMEAQGNHDLNDEQSDEQMKDVVEEQGNHDLNDEQSDEQMKDVM